MTDVDNSLKLWLQLIRAKGVGPATASKLLDAFGSIEVLYRASASQLRKAGLKPAAIESLLQPDLELIEQDLAWAQQDKNHIVVLGSEHYPAQLARIARPPVVLFVHGDPQVLSLPQLAIVGSRHPTSTGKRHAEQFAETFAQQGLTVTSGLAHGVDGAAHHGALKGGGLTIAVFGTGLDRVYPAVHKKLAHEIAEEGALVSEYPLGTPSKPDNFPRRNRIVSGLALGSLVVEAAQRSGSLITARYATEQGREVFAIPGSINNPLARGCHALIRDGAKLVETAEHVLEELAPLIPEYSPKLTEKTSISRDAQLDQLGFEPLHIDEVVDKLAMPLEAVQALLIEYELSGQITMLDDGRYVREQ